MPKIIMLSSGGGGGGPDVNDVVTNPSSTQTIQPTAVGATPLALKGFAGQTADLLDITDSAGNSFFKLDKAGRVTASATWDETVTTSAWEIDVLAAARTVNGTDTPFGMRVQYRSSSDAFTYTGDTGMELLTQFLGTKTAGSGNQANTITGMQFSLQDFDNDSFAPATGDVGTYNACFGGITKIASGVSGALTAFYGSITSYNGLAAPGNITDVFAFRGYWDLEPVTGATISNATMFGMQAPFFGAAGGTITNVYGLHALNLGHAGVTNSYGVYIDAQSGSTNPYAIYSAGGASVLLAGAAGVTPLLLQAAATPTADILRWNSSVPATLGRIDKNGTFVTKVNAAPADADLNANEAAIWFDPTAGAAKLMVKAKNASGTVVTGSLALA